MLEAWQTTPAAVVGAGGFIGRALVAGLGERGVPALPLGRRELGAPRELAALLDGVGTVFWSASSITPAVAETEPHRIDDDRHALRGFLDVLATAAPAARLVYLSSGGTVYGSGTPPYTEDSPTRTTSAYGRAKLAMESDVLRRWSAPTVVRISNAYGPGQPAAPGQGVVGHWLRALARREPIRVFGDLRTVRDYLYIGDLVDALVRIHASDDVPELLNLGSGVPTSLADVLATVRELRDAPDVEVELLGSRSFDLDAVWLDVSAARRVLGWEPRTRLADGVAAAWTHLLRPPALTLSSDR